MSLENNDEFVVFPSGTGQDVATFDVRYSRSHNPGYAGGSGRQHRPTEPANTTLRCNEAEVLGTPRPDCEVNPDMVKVPCSKSGPPGAKVDGLGKFVEPCTQVGSGRHSQGAAMLGAEPASVIGELFGVNSGTQQPVYFPQWRPAAGLRGNVAPPAVGSGENEVCQSLSGSISGEVDMEVEDIRGEFKAANAVRNLSLIHISEPTRPY